MKYVPVIVSLLSATALSCGILRAAPVAASPDTLNQYIINNHPVEKFDGSQLEGKKVVSYQISTVKASEEDVIRIHEIQAEGITVRVTGNAEPIYVIDGKKVSKRKFENLSPAAIKSITVVKNGTQEEVKQYPGWENGVILVETKGDNYTPEIKDSQVNIGYGTVDIRDVSYSVSSVKSEGNQFYTNMYEYLRGKVAGVDVLPDNSIVIRGKTTMNASSEPLVLVDGVEITDLNLINPNDVYSVDVLKDASASIYGMKGANGVILITTKKHDNSPKSR